MVKQLEQLSWNVPKKAVLRFLRKHAWRRPLYPGVQLAAWYVTIEKLHQIFFLVTYLKLLATSILPVGRLRLAVSQATTSAAWYYLVNINSNVLLNAIICEVYHCQLILINQYISIWSLWYRISFSFLVGSFFQP